MEKIYQSITDLIGNTPILKLNNVQKNLHLLSEILVKIESFNPMSSAKDRVGFAMLRDALDKKIIDKNTVIIEPTSGNTGVGLAFTAAAFNMKVILTMPDTMSLERRRLLSALGAELILTEGSLGMKGAIKKAEELQKTIPNSYIPQQFENPSNPLAHKKTTAMEILADTDGKLDYFVSAVGTGGTITGVGEVLKEKIPDIKIVAVEPYTSSVLSGLSAGKHGIQGIGAGFVPKVLDTDIIDEIIRIKDDEAFATAKMLAHTEGVLAGISSGAALKAAIKIAEREQGKRILAFLPDTGERYLSTGIFD